MGLFSDSPKEENKKYKILAIDDNKDILELLKIHLEKSKESLSVETAQSSEKALNLIEKNDYDAILADYKMPKYNGLELLKKVRDKGIESLYFIFTGKGGEETSQKALKLGANGYFMKTTNPRERIDEIANVLEKSIEKRQQDEKYMIAWIIAWANEKREKLKDSLRKLADKVGFKIEELIVQEISSEKEGIKAFTKSYSAIPIEKKDIVKKWKKVLDENESVVRADAKLDKRIQKMNNSKNN